MTSIHYPKANPFLQTPVSVLVANEHLNRLNCTDFINSVVSWNPDRCSISPGVLAKAVVLSTFYETRSPLYHIASRFDNADTEFLFGTGVKSSHLNDDAIAACLDKIYEVGPDKLFSGFALSAYAKYDLDLSRLHSDTSNIVMYGDYDI